MGREKKARVSRRSFLSAAAGTAGLVAASSALPSRAAATVGRSCRPVRPREDICIIGAGFAGLAAARAAIAAGASVVVVEARDRVGGRVLNDFLSNGEPIEKGGQWLGPTQTEILGLAQEFGVDTFPTYNTGNNLMDFQGAITSYPAVPGLPPIAPGDLQELLVVIGEVDALAAQVGAETPWAFAGAVDLDRMTVQQWMDDRLTTDGARFLVDLSVRSVFTIEPHELSYLFFLSYVAGAGGLFPLISVAGGAQQDRIVGGTQLIAERMAAEFKKKTLRFGLPVQCVQECDGGVRVYAGRKRFRVEHVVCTLPPTLAGRILYEPGLPPQRDQLTQRMPMGSVIKVNVEYPTPFWRALGLSGQFLADTGPVRVGFDNSPPSASVGVLNAFISGDDARALGLLTESDRRDAVVQRFASLFGSQALSETRYFESDWSTEEFTRGCFAGFLPPGGVVPYMPAIREPIGRLHWAGTETAEVWPGYIEGAVRSGMRAAAEITSP